MRPVYGPSIGAIVLPLPTIVYGFQPELASTRVLDRARQSQVEFAVTVSTPYVNTIPSDAEPDFPGDELLERRMKYDRLGINDALLQFEADLNRNMLPEPQRALPALDQISGNPQFVEIARQRARTLAERIRHGAATS